MCYDVCMRTTIDLDDDLLQLARELAAQRQSTIGQVVSELARKGLESKTPPKVRNGILLFPPKPGAKKAHMGLVNRLRDQE